jgi:hypothetical protein
MSPFGSIFLFKVGRRPHLRLFRLLAKLVGKKERQYKSLKVRDVVTAIETKRWPE